MSQGKFDLEWRPDRRGHRWRTPPHLYAPLKLLARDKRKEPTPAEKRLRWAVRNRQISGVKFRRQHPIGQFIVDFYSREARLVIEVDGPIHDYTPEQDAIRQEYIEYQGLTVLRFTNDEVFNSLETVINQIKAALPDTPSPPAGKGAGDGV